MEALVLQDRWWLLFDWPNGFMAEEVTPYYGVKSTASEVSGKAAGLMLCLHALFPEVPYSCHYDFPSFVGFH